MPRSDAENVSAKLIGSTGLGSGRNRRMGARPWRAALARVGGVILSTRHGGGDECALAWRRQEGTSVAGGARVTGRSEREQRGGVGRAASDRSDARV